jgi:hypothetical protein
LQNKKQKRSFWIFLAPHRRTQKPNNFGKVDPETLRSLIHVSEMKNLFVYRSYVNGNKRKKKCGGSRKTNKLVCGKTKKKTKKKKLGSLTY